MNATAPWHAAYPAPKHANPDSLTPSQVLALLQGADSNGQRESYVLVDLRRADYEGGMIRGSINLPAQSLYPTIPKLYSLFHAAGVSTVVWYCGSSKGRGTRAAGWFCDHIDDQQDDKMRSVVLKGGIKAWVSAGEEYISFMDEYDPVNWE